MKKSKFTEEQIAFALKQAELGSTGEAVGRKIGISRCTATDQWPGTVKH